MFKFLRSTPARVITLMLVLQAAMLYSSVRPEAVPLSDPLDAFPKAVDTWKFIADSPIDEDQKAILQADDLLSRYYGDTASGKQAYFFVAGFRSQRNGKAPHSPKNCLPGSGWTPLKSDQYPIEVGTPEPVSVNRYVVAHGDDRSLVMYWYQSRDRVVASEYTAKFWVMVDSMRLNRTDTALVKVVVPIYNNDEEAATKVASDFVKSIFHPLHRYLPA